MGRFGFVAKRCKEQNELKLGPRMSAWINNDSVTIYKGVDGQGFFIRKDERWYKLIYKKFEESCNDR